MCQRHCRHPPIVEPDESLAGGVRGGSRHRFGVRNRCGKRLLACNVLAGFERSDSRIAVDVVRSSDINEVGVFAGDGGLPVGRVVLPAPGGSEVGELRGVASDDGVHSWPRRHLEEATDLTPSIRVCPSHELGPEQCDIQSIGHGSYRSFVDLVFLLGGEEPRHARSGSYVDGGTLVSGWVVYR